MKDKIFLSIPKQVGLLILQHYFVSAWIPNQDVNNQLYSITDSKKNNVASIGYRGPVVSIPAGATETITSSLWTGPKLQNKMAGSG